MSELLTEFIGLLVGGITEMATGIGTGLNAAVTSMFITTTESGMALSTFGGVIAIFAGVALAVGFVSLIFYWIRSIGN